MKKILITGKKSYVGKSFKKWLESNPDKYFIDTMSLKDNNWKNKDFSTYDVIFHVAGIAHVSSDPKMEGLYYKVNVDLTIETAKKAKAEGVRQFIFMSSIIVYGDSINDRRVINEETEPSPSNFYGESKLQAEKGLKVLESEEFKIVIIRPPMIYGKGSKGNYPKLAKIAKNSFLFPDIDNSRSMLHIDNLCEFIRLSIDNEERGTFFPQNKEYVKTSEMVKLISEAHGKKMKLTKGFNPILNLLKKNSGTLKKVFGNMIYDKKLSYYKDNYQIRDFKESIMETEKLPPTSTYEELTKLDVLLLADNNLETVGGEQESTKIIINGVKDYFSTGVIQPGLIKGPIEKVSYYPMSVETRIKHLVKKPISFLKYIFETRKIINQTRPRIIHTQAQVSFFIVALLRKIGLVPENVKVIHTERGLYTKYNKIFKLLFRFFIKELDVLITTTEFNMSYWRRAIENWNIPLDFKVIENTAGELFESYDKKLEATPKEGLVVGFAGRYTDWKNWPLAVNIVKELNEVLGDRLMVKMAVGCLDENSLKKTEVMFNDLRKVLGQRFDGKINIKLNAMNEFYYGIDIFILTSNYNTESFGRTLVEAMSRKTVVLTTDAGGSVEVIGNSENVCQTPDEFVERILHFNNDKNKMVEEKASNIERVKEVYSLKNNINKHLHLYNEI